MPLPPKLVPALLGLILTLAACGRGEDPSLVLADVLRCELEGDPTPAYRQASADLIDAARRDPGILAGDLIVAYEAPRGFLGLRAGRDVAPDVRREFGLTLRRSIGEGRDLVAADDVLAAAERLLADPRVRYAHPAVILEPHALPSDPEYRRQWSLSRFGLQEGWDLERGSREVTIAVVDAGIDVSHPEFAGRLEAGWDFYDGDPDVASLSSHGTHVTGIAAANGDNGVGISGIAPAGVRILPIKVFADDPNLSDERSLGAVARAIRWAAGLDVDAGTGPARRAAPVQVINLSLGTDRSYLNVPLLDEAIRDARARGVVVVASVGNQGNRTGITSPANSPCALAVGSADETRLRSSFSNFDDDERLVDLVAPGGFSNVGDTIYSTVRQTDPDRAYGYMHGTSMAAPFVSGAAALLASAHPDWTDVQILERLLITAYRPSDTLEMEMGFGLACVDAALGAPTRCGR